MELLRTGNVRLAFERYGSGRPVVFIAGIGAGRDMWLPSHIAALTDAGHEVVVFNNRGIPPSDVPPPPYSIDAMAADAAGLIEALALPPSTVVGFSLGALVAQELALARPDLIRAAVLIGSLGRKDVTRRQLAHDAARDITSAHASGPSAAVRALQLFGPSTLGDDDWMTRYLAGAGASVEATPGLVGQQLASSAYDNRLGALAGIEVPCLIVSFELDLLVPAQLGRELASTIPGAHYAEVGGCGHGGLWERPNIVMSTIVEFLRGLDAAPEAPVDNP